MTNAQIRQAAVTRLLTCSDGCYITEWSRACELVRELDHDLGTVLANWANVQPFPRSVDGAAKVIENWICTSKVDHQ